MTVSSEMKRQFSAAKVAWVTVLFLQAGVLALSVGVLLRGRPAPVLVVAAVLTPVATTLLKRYAGQRFGHGERLRRALAEQDGLGVAIPLEELLGAAANSPLLASLDPDPIGGYYTSPLDPGPRRWASITAQASLFTTAHAGAARALCVAAAGGGLAVGVLLLLRLALADGIRPEDRMRFVQVVASVMMVGFTTEFMRLGFLFHDLRTAAQRAVESCCRLAERADATDAEVRRAVAAYDMALAKTGVPLPGWIYRLQRRRLDSVWKRQARLSAQPAKETSL